MVAGHAVAAAALAGRVLVMLEESVICPRRKTGILGAEETAWQAASVWKLLAPGAKDFGSRAYPIQRRLVKAGQPPWQAARMPGQEGSIFRG